MSRREIAKIAAVIVLFLLLIPIFQSLFFRHAISGKIAVNKEVKADFLPKSDKKIILLFFGYYGCADVCAPFLQDLNLIYESKEFLPYKNEVDFYFVNLNSKVKQHEPSDFANYFNKNFKGVYLLQKEIMLLDRNFGLYHAVSLRDENEIEHTGSLYILQKEGEKVILKYFYLNKFLQKEILIEDIKAMLAER